MTSETEHGYLVLADISGYTSYLAQTELEHAQEILTDLLATIVDQFKQALTISKLEGDAVFANVNESNLPNGERLLELIESKRGSGSLVKYVSSNFCCFFSHSSHLPTVSSN
mgnify:CR=1 FL=1